MSTFKVVGASQTREALAIMILSLPNDFPPTVKERSPEYWFALTFAGLETITSRAAKQEGGAEFLARIRAICQKAEQLYEAGQVDEGRFLLQEADVALGDLSRAFRGGKTAKIVSTWHQYGVPAMHKEAQ